MSTLKNQNNVKHAVHSPGFFWFFFFFLLSKRIDGNGESLEKGVKCARDHAEVGGKKKFATYKNFTENTFLSPQVGIHTTLPALETHVSE